MEVLRDHKASIWEGEDLKSGDLERVRVEWKSLLSLIAKGPELADARWVELQGPARSLVGKDPVLEELPVLPELPGRQKERFARSVSSGQG